MTKSRSMFYMLSLLEAQSCAWLAANVEKEIRVTLLDTACDTYAHEWGHKRTPIGGDS